MPYHFVSQAKLPTAHGLFDIHVFENEEGEEHVMLSVGLPAPQIKPNISTNTNAESDTGIQQTIDNTNQTSKTDEQTIPIDAQIEKKVPLIRIHSECLTGDAFRSLKCDCGPQLNTAMAMIQQHGCGAILYLRQEGRGIGLVNKIRAYALQDQGHDTLEANLRLGLPADARIYDMCQPMLAHLNIDTVRLLTNNPNKLNYLTNLGINVLERVPLLVGINEYNSDYLSVKGEKMGHMIEASDIE